MEAKVNRPNSGQRTLIGTNPAIFYATAFINTLRASGGYLRGFIFYPVTFAKAVFSLLHFFASSEAL
jgi:hypothetical protein